MAYQDCTDLQNNLGTELGFNGAVRNLLISVYSRITSHLEKRRQRRIDRDAFRHMLLLDDDILDDIGVTRSNVKWASQLPTHISASAELEKTARRARPRIRPTL